ncbi:hypothetical protein [Bartonella ancashensis]|uniref:hypothetical protein n=1 Tax=Bartonella ancashensis TaxID=1318743 RepID=UPI0006B4BB80|nr:hypothetical protein [Bartonella ancashensis]
MKQRRCGPFWCLPAFSAGVTVEAHLIAFSAEVFCATPIKEADKVGQRVFALFFYGMQRWFLPYFWVWNGGCLCFVLWL